MRVGESHIGEIPKSPIFSFSAFSIKPIFIETIIRRANNLPPPALTDPFFSANLRRSLRYMLIVLTITIVELR